MNDDKDESYKKFLAQNTENSDINEVSEISDSDNIDSIEIQDSVDNVILSSRNDKTFDQCSSAGDIYSEDELNE